jgi:hypothetical protein
LNFSGTADVLSQGVHSYIDELQVSLNTLGQTIFETYVKLPQQVAGIAKPQVFDPFEIHLQKQQQQQQQQAPKSRRDFISYHSAAGPLQQSHATLHRAAGGI